MGGPKKLEVGVAAIDQCVVDDDVSRFEADRLFESVRQCRALGSEVQLFSNDPDFPGNGPELAVVRQGLPGSRMATA